MSTEYYKSKNKEGKLVNKIFLLILLGVSSISFSADTCFPPEVVAGKTLEGKNVTFNVLEVHGCWIKAIVCSRGNCKDNEAYWVHASEVEVFKAEVLE